MMRFAVACVLLAACVAANLNELHGEPTWSSDLRSASHSLSMNGGDLSLHYEAGLHPAALVLTKHLPTVPTAVTCATAEALALHFESAADAAAAAALLVSGTLLSGATDFSCSNGRLIHVRVAFAAALGSDVIVKGDIASPIDFFKDASVRFATNSWPSLDGAVDTRFDAAQVKTVSFNAMRMQQRSWFSNWLSDLWHDVLTLIKDAYELIQKYLPQIEQLILTGSLDFPPTAVLTRNLSYNYPNTQPIPIPLNISGLTLTCSDCYAYLDLALLFALDVSQYALTNVSLLGQGNAKVMAGGDLSATWTGNFAWTGTLYTVQPPPLVIPIAGIPFTFSFVMPITAGASAQLTANADVQAHAEATGSFTYGVVYDPQTKAVQQVTSHNYSTGGSLDSIHVGFDGALNMYVAPVPALSVDYIGSIYCSIKGSSELTVEADAGNGGNVCGNNALYAALNGAVAVTFGAEVGLTVDGKTLFGTTWGPTGLYSNKWDIGSGCINLTGIVGPIVSEPRAKPSVNFSIGTVWSGTMFQSACHGQMVVPPGNVTLQLVQNNDNGAYFVLATNQNFTATQAWSGVWGSCMSQALYGVVAYDQSRGTIEIEPVTDEWDNIVGYASCTNPDVTLTAPPFVGRFTGDLVNIELHPVMQTESVPCATFNLTRAH